MPRRTRTQPQRFVAGAVTQKPKKSPPKVVKSTVAPALQRTQSRSLSMENDAQCIRGRIIVPSPTPEAVPHVLQEIHRLQSTTKLQIPKLPFARLIREVLMKYTGYGKDYRITAECLECIQEAAEIYVVQLFEDSNKCCHHRDRVILCPKDMKLAFFFESVGDKRID